MARAKQKRDNDYYLERLRTEHPVIHADFQAGRFKNLSEALVKAGIRKARTSLDALETAWKKATTAERDAFKAFIGCATPTLVSAPTSTLVHVKSSIRVPSSPPGKQHLPHALEAAVREIMKRRGLKTGDVMREIGRTPLDASLGMALKRETQLQDSLIEGLEAWAAKNKTP